MGKTDFIAVTSGCKVILCIQAEETHIPAHSERVKDPKEPAYLLFSAHAPDCRPPTYRWQTLLFSQQLNCKVII